MGLFFALMLLPVIAWLLDWAARKRSFVFDFVVLSVSVMLYVIVVRTVVVAILGEAKEEYAPFVLLGSIAGIVTLRYWLGRAVRARRAAPTSASASYASRTSKYAGYRRVA